MTDVTVKLRKKKDSVNFVRYDNPDPKSMIMNNIYVGKDAFGPRPDPDDTESYPDEVQVTVSWEN